MFGVLLGASMAWLMPACATASPTKYEVMYEVLRNGKKVAETTGRFEVNGNNWLIESETVGKKGLAWVLGVRANEQSTGVFEGTAPLPDRFSHSVKLRGPDQGWSAEFDRQTGVVHTQTDEGSFALEYARDVFDPGSLQLALRRALQDGESDWPARVVDEDQLDQHRYVASDPLRVDTALGCRELTPVERIREGSSRYVFSWHDPEFEFLPLRIVKGKHGGDETEARLLSLTWEGGPVIAGPPCSEK